MILNFDFIRSVLPAALCKGKPLSESARWVVDSRKITGGDIFIALLGAKTDGHHYILSALERGAAGIVMATSMQRQMRDYLDAYQDRVSFIIVDDPYVALCTLAAVWRKQFSYPVIGITGSAGKTTTKEVLGNILRCNSMRFVISQGNQNTLLGISLNILQMRSEHQAAVFEMGISKRGEMAELAQLVLPTIAIITSVGHCHMEGLGSLVDIASEKRDIFTYLPDNGIGIIDGDQPLLTAISYPHPIIKFGNKMVNQVQARKIEHGKEEITFQLKIYNERYAIRLMTENSARVYNALAATAAAHALGISAESICRGIQEPVAVAGRFRKCPIQGSSCIIIDDSYNANPESMKAALEAFESMESSGKKIAILGDMLELGITAPFWHRQLGRFLRKVPSLNQVVLVGEHVQWAHKMVPQGLPVQWVKTWEEALVVVQKQLHDASLVLVKGSRGVHLGKLVDALSA